MITVLVPQNGGTLRASHGIGSGQIRPEPDFILVPRFCVSYFSMLFQYMFILFPHFFLLVPEYRSTGILEYDTTRTLEYKSTRVLEH